MNTLRRLNGPVRLEGEQRVAQPNSHPTKKQSLQTFLGSGGSGCAGRLGRLSVPLSVCLGRVPSLILGLLALGSCSPSKRLAEPWLAWQCMCWVAKPGAAQLGVDVTKGRDSAALRPSRGKLGGDHRSLGATQDRPIASGGALSCSRNDHFFP